MKNDRKSEWWVLWKVAAWTARKEDEKGGSKDRREGVKKSVTEAWS